MIEAIVEKPLRVDLAGGWSDTPPICYELGSCVLNFAVTLNGIKPVKAHVRRIGEAKVLVESVDLRKKGVYVSDEEIADHADPHDWGCLIKSALTVVGYTMKEGGLQIRIAANVPKGSGLGTSSILGSALVEALGKVLDRNYDWRRVCDLTLRLEKEMCTGGGWQDQVGGLLPGVKLIVSHPGNEQKLRIRRPARETTEAFAQFLSDRALLYFTGQKRMARNVLRGVLNFYKENPDGIAHAIIDRLRRDAAKAYDSLVAQDWDALCAAINGYWLAKKALDPGSTNPEVETIIARIAPWTSAVSLCGAGGGGFMLIVAESVDSKSRIKGVLERHPPIQTGAFYEISIA